MTRACSLVRSGKVYGIPWRSSKVRLQRPVSSRALLLVKCEQQSHQRSLINASLSCVLQVLEFDPNTKAIALLGSMASTNFSATSGSDISGCRS